MSAKSLDQKLAAIHADPSGCREFILADAKDADMAFGVGAPGLSPEMHAGEPRFRTLADYRAQIRQVVQQGLVDIVLMSASTNEQLTIRERLFEGSHVTPAARANDTSDIFVVRGGRYAEHPSQPFRTATIDHIQCGKHQCRDSERVLGANLGLYSITFNNRLEDDLGALEEYRRFRLEAEQRGFRHFLELFDPNAPHQIAPDEVPAYINDCIARTLAGVTGPGRPLFLKIVYHGPKAMEELVRYDPHLIVGILGGGAGTTYDAFKLLAEAQKYGARVALYGRKINNAECQLAFIQFLRLIVEGQISPEEAVAAYHGVLGKLKIRPHRSLGDDLQLTTGVMSYSGRGSAAVPGGLPAGGSSNGAPKSRAAGNPVAGGKSQSCGCGCQEQGSAAAKAGEASCGCAGSKESAQHGAAAPGAQTNGKADFAAMSPAEKRAWQQAKRDRIWGRF